MISATAEDRDKLIMYLRGKTDSLTDHQLIMFERINTADDLIKTWGRKKAQEMIIQKFPGISARTAYRIISDAIHVFGSMHKAEKIYFQNTAVDKLLRAISGAEKELFKEDENGEIKPITDPKLLKAYVEAISELRRTIGYDKHDDFAAPDWEKIGANPIHLTLNPKDIGIDPVEDLDQFKREILEKIAVDSPDVDFEEQ